MYFRSLSICSALMNNSVIASVRYNTHAQSQHLYCIGTQCIVVRLTAVDFMKRNKSTFAVTQWHQQKTFCWKNITSCMLRRQSSRFYHYFRKKPDVVPIYSIMETANFMVISQQFRKVMRNIFLWTAQKHCSWLFLFDCIFYINGVFFVFRKKDYLSCLLAVEKTWCQIWSFYALFLGGQCL